jgi:hypothetical protein
LHSLKVNKKVAATSDEDRDGRTRYELRGTDAPPFHSIPKQYTRAALRTWLAQEPAARLCAHYHSLLHAHDIEPRQ